MNFMKKDLKNQFRESLLLYRNRLIYVGVLLLITLLFFVFRGSRSVMNFMTDYVTHPIRGVLAKMCSFTVWSVSEWVLIVAVLFALLLLFFFIFSLIRRRKQWLSVLFQYLLSFASYALTISVLLTLLWNVNYYADTFQDKSGIRAKEASVEELYETTLYFVGLLSDVSGKIERNGNGLYSEDTDSIFDESSTLYRNVEQDFPFLSGKELRTKKVLFSRAMSEVRTTGVAFPFTGEANVNIDQPPAFIPVTIAHEIAHQRKIASEQEANFVAILACDYSDLPAYRYSGYLLAYNYLASALSREDFDLYREIALSLPPDVRVDLYLNNQYWKQFDSKVSEISDTLYDDYLKGQGQELGTKSYGAVVDLLIAYYHPKTSS